MLAREPERTSPSKGCATPKNLRTNLTLRVPPAFTSKKMELTKLYMMKLPTPVMALTVPEIGHGETGLVFERQTIRNQLLPSEHSLMVTHEMASVFTHRPNSVMRRHSSSTNHVSAAEMWSSKPCSTKLSQSVAKPDHNIQKIKDAFRRDLEHGRASNGTVGRRLHEFVNDVF